MTVNPWIKCLLLGLLLLSKSAWADYPVQFLERRATTEIKLVNGKPRSTHRVVEVMEFSNERASAYSERAVYHGFFSKLTKIEAHSLVPQGNNKFRKVKVNQYSDHADVDDGIFFDDSRRRSFRFPELVPGARGVLNYELSYEEPKIQPGFYFSTGWPVALAVYELRVQEGISIEHKLFNAEGIDLTYTVSKQGKFEVHRWEARQVPAKPDADFSPDRRYYLPHLLQRITAYGKGSKQTRLLDSPAGLYRSYYPYIKHIYEDDHAELRELVDSLTASLTEPMQKAAAIYQWVQNNLKYVAFEEDYRGLRPFEPKQVIGQRFGDCKDMSAVLYSLMRLADLPVYMAWIGTRDIPYSYYEWPGLQTDNHMIAVYHTADTTLFFDGTGSYTVFGYPTEMIQGKEVLIGLDAERYAIAKVPVLPASANTSFDSIQMRFEQGQLVGNAQSQLSGFLKSDYSYKLHHLNSEQLRKKLSETLSWGNNSFTVLNPVYSNQLRTTDPLVLKFDFSIRDHVIKLDDELIVNLQLDKSLLKLRVELENREVPMELPHAFRARSVVRFQIPEGYVASSIPPAAQVVTPFGTYEVSYQLQGQVLEMRQQTEVNKVYIEVHELAEWNQFLNQLRNIYRQSVTLKKSTP